MEIYPGLYNNPLHVIFPQRVRLAAGAEDDIMKDIEESALKDSMTDAVKDAVEKSIQDSVEAGVGDAVKDSIRKGLTDGSITSLNDLSKAMAEGGLDITGDSFAMATVLGEDAGKVGEDAMAGGERGAGGEMKTPEEAKLENSGENAGKARKARAQALEDLNKKLDTLSEDQKKLTQQLEDGLKDTCKDSKFCKWKGNSVMNAVKTFLKVAIPLTAILYLVGAFSDDGGTCKFQGWPSNEEECTGDKGAAKLYTNATGVWNAANKTCTITQGTATGFDIITSDNCNHTFRRDVSQGTKFMSGPNRCQVTQWPRDATGCESVATTASATNTGTFDGSVEWVDNCCTMKGGKMKKTDCQHYCQKPCDGGSGSSCYSSPSFFDKLGRGLKCVFGVFGGDDCLTNSIMDPIKRFLMQALYVLLVGVLIYWVLFWRMWPLNLLFGWAYAKSTGSKSTTGQGSTAVTEQQGIELTAPQRFQAAQGPPELTSQAPANEEFMSQFQSAFESSLSSLSSM